MGSRRHVKKVVHIIKTVFLTVFIGGIALLCLMPLIYTFVASFMSNAELNSHYGAVFGSYEDGLHHYIAQNVKLRLIPEIVSFVQYYKALFQSTEYLATYWNSIIYVVPIVIFQLVTAVLCAYGFSRLKGKPWAVLFFVYIILMLMPFQVTLVPNYIVSKWLKIFDTRFAIWMPGIFSPFSVYILTRYFKRIPREMYEQAKIDGAGELGILTRIYLPMGKSAVMSCAMLVFMDYWNMVEQPLVMLNDESLYPMSIFLARTGADDIGIAFALAVLYMVPCILLFIYGEEDLSDGLAGQTELK